MEMRVFFSTKFGEGVSSPFSSHEKIILLPPSGEALRLEYGSQIPGHCDAPS